MSCKNCPNLYTTKTHVNLQHFAIDYYEQLTQYSKQGSMCLAEDTCEARTRNPSISSQALYH